MPIIMFTDSYIIIMATRSWQYVSSPFQVCQQLMNPMCYQVLLINNVRVRFHLRYYPSSRMSHLVTPIHHLLVEMRKGKITRRVSLIDIISKKKGKSV